MTDPGAPSPPAKETFAVKGGGPAVSGSVPLILTNTNMSSGEKRRASEEAIRSKKDSKKEGTHVADDELRLIHPYVVGILPRLLSAARKGRRIWQWHSQTWRCCLKQCSETLYYYGFKKKGARDAVVRSLYW